MTHKQFLHSGILSKSTVFEVKLIKERFYSHSIIKRFQREKMKRLWSHIGPWEIKSQKKEKKIQGRRILGFST